MAYCTYSDITDQLDEATLVQLTDDENLGQVNQDRVNAAIADADGEINGYLGARHHVPLDPVPPIIKTCSVDIAVYNLYSRRSVAPEDRFERYRARIRYLEKVAEGKISLGADDPEGSPPDTDAPRMSSANPARIFDRDKMKDY